MPLFNKLRALAKKKARSFGLEADTLPKSPTSSCMGTRPQCRMYLDLPRTIRRRYPIAPGPSLDKLRREEMARTSWEVSWGVVDELEFGDWSIVKWVTSYDPIYSVYDIIELAQEYLTLREDHFIFENQEDLLMQTLDTMLATYPLGHRIRDTLQHCSVMDRWKSISRSRRTLEWDGSTDDEDESDGEEDWDTAGDSTVGHNGPESTDHADTHHDGSTYQERIREAINTFERQDPNQDMLDVKSVAITEDVMKTWPVPFTMGSELEADSGYASDPESTPRSPLPTRKKKKRTFRRSIYNQEWQDLIRSHQECKYQGTYVVCTKNESEKWIPERD
ncbi:unnamed protein product [Diplocarpon coronariae]|uniref:Squalene-hopene cyclase n=1 Tax=Diplocarpon coronariae TaxID=2795749 RepID=A0A218Z384_9HELO|nr:hypothetical protein JHW43_002912 [Diplocarpon mali]OWP01705.1 squalene-hopene cyclase [Marssonina coronariae]